MTQHVLIVGGTGFLGSQLTRRLLSQDCQVTHLSLASRPSRPVPPAVTVCRASDPTPLAIERVLDGRHFDLVFHMAAAGVDPRDRELTDLFEGNLVYPAAVVEALRHSPPDCVVTAGSWAEYQAAPQPQLLNEDYPLGGVEPYGASKAAGGIWTRAVAAKFNIPLVHVRLFQIYGQGEEPHRLFSMLRSRLLHGMPVPLSPGKQVRDFVYVQDAIDGLLAAAGAPAGGVYNLCSGIPVSVRDFALTVADSLGLPHSLLRFGEIPQRPGELPWAVGSNQRLFEATGWRPSRTIRDAMADFAIAEATAERTVS